MTAHQMLAKVRSLPPVSRAAVELGNLLDRPDTSNEEIIRVLREDGVLTAKLLRACNSSALALREQVGSVDQAVMLLGYRQISQMVTALAFRDPLAIPLGGYGLGAGELWRHSLLAATAAQIVASAGIGAGVDSSLAFTIGLLHDIGKVITNEFLTRQSSLAIDLQCAEGRSLIEAERDVLGADHAEVGAALAYMWRLPDTIVEGLALHHQSGAGSRQGISGLACLADRLAHWKAAAEAGPGDPLPDMACEVYGLSPEGLEYVSARLSDAHATANELMAVTA